MGTTPPYRCDKGYISQCPWSCVPFAWDWGALGPCAPTQGCHELSCHAKLSPGSLPQGAATHPPGPALCNSMLAVSLAGQMDSARAQLCSLSSGSCPAMCTCSNGIVDCRGKGLTAIPANLPETMTEM